MKHKKHKVASFALKLIFALAIAALPAYAQQTSSSLGKPAMQTAFVHPGLLNTEADFARMKAKVALGAEPWASAYKALTSN